MNNIMELLHLQITIFGSEKEGKLGILLEGFTRQDQVDVVMEQFNKFMRKRATRVTKTANKDEKDV